MIVVKNNEISWLEFPLFAQFPELRHAFSLRHGGVSEPPFASLNLGGSGDLPERIAENRNRFSLAVVAPEAARLRQVGGRNVVVLSSADEPVQEGDALITNRPGVALFLLAADCQPTILYDPTKRVVAAVHSGWKGSVLNIYKATIDRMKHQFGCRPEDLFVGIGPSLGPKMAEFVNFRTELPPPFWAYQVRENHFDFWAISEMQLTAAGIPKAQIEMARICTRSHPEAYFSARRERVTGRHALILWLQK